MEGGDNGRKTFACERESIQESHAKETCAEAEDVFQQKAFIEDAYAREKSTISGRCFLEEASSRSEAERVRCFKNPSFFIPKTPQKMSSSSPSNEQKIEELFSHHMLSFDQTERMQKVREATKALAHVIIENCPASPDRSAAIRLLRETSMTANASIVLENIDTRL